MSDLSLSEAFAHYGAKLVNRQWAVSSIAEDGALVISCWAHLFRKVDTVLRYEDKLSRWQGNAAGNNLFKQHIVDAINNDRLVRLVIATAEDPDTIDSGNEASTVKKTFHIKPNMVGRIKLFDGDKLIIDFQRKVPGQ